MGNIIEAEFKGSNDFNAKLDSIFNDETAFTAFKAYIDSNPAAKA